MPPTRLDLYIYFIYRLRYHLCTPDLHGIRIPVIDVSDGRVMWKIA